MRLNRASTCLPLARSLEIVSNHSHSTKEPPEEGGAKPSERLEPETLSVGVRIVLILVGWMVLLVGIAGLVLPGLQGILTILLAAAILSAASSRVHVWMNRALRRWPALSTRMESLRHKLLTSLSRRK